jgi:hypothetical protein
MFEQLLNNLRNINYSKDGEEQAGRPIYSYESSDFKRSLNGLCQVTALVPLSYYKRNDRTLNPTSSAAMLKALSQRKP